MELLGKFLLAVVLLFVLSKLFPMTESYHLNMIGGGDAEAEDMMSAEMTPTQMMPAQMVEMPVAESEQRMARSHEVQSEMGQGPAQAAPAAQGEVLGTMSDEFGAAASVPKCEDEFCTGCLFCQTAKSSSCGYATDDKQSSHSYMDTINRIRQDKGEDWNQNFKIA